MVDGTLNDHRDEYFAEIQKGDLVFLQADDGSELSGIAIERSLAGWIVEGGNEVIEDENYLGHVSRNFLTMQGQAS